MGLKSHTLCLQLPNSVGVQQPAQVKSPKYLTKRHQAHVSINGYTALSEDKISAVP